MDYIGFLKRFRFLERKIRETTNKTVHCHTSKECSKSSCSNEVPNTSKLNLLLQVADECQTEAELRQLIEKKPNFLCYDGFEPSGRMHVAQGLYKAINVNRCADAGGNFVFWIADWFALMNDKMGGELQRIRLVGKYFVEVWKACGMKMDHVSFRWASEEINKNPKEYWKRVLDIAKRNSLSRITKCCQIMGRKEGTLSASQILYPLMQCSDIFFLKADICQLGLDQRKVNMLARDYCDQIGRKLKPIILSHHMIGGLKELREEDGSLKKMSKSVPDSAIFMEDSAEEVNRKIFAAYCPKDNEIESNPCLDYIRSIVFAKQDHFLEFKSFDEVQRGFVNGALTEDALKRELARLLNSYIEPVRDHFAQNPSARDILSMVHNYNSPKTADASPAESSKPTGNLVIWMYPRVSLGILEALHIVQAANKRIEEGLRATIVYADWTAEAVHCQYTRKEKDADTLFQYATSCLKSYDLHHEVNIVRQSAEILTDSDRYWLGVIQIGRKLILSTLMDHWGIRGMPLAGNVLAALMYINDIVFFGATEILCYSNPQHTACPSASFSDFTIDFLKSEFSRNIQIQELQNDILKPLCDDTEEIIRKEIKKLYAPMLEVEKNQLLELTGAVLGISGGGEICIWRDGEQDGHPYPCIENIEQDYTTGKLHPGDLKQSIAKLLAEKTSQSRSSLSNFVRESPGLSASLKSLRKK
ncbi:tyrosyl-tRNA synthetase [Perkinsela sp. CCAP 1560/4]|nr:tyrosyl-tRNA synthetase [Perkinsela sp. CCAP 1560/4]|eukprot:KNH06577.1 tyrosyl-tRNA synthetase [Perkinsela sp. CCAP 1560/4]